jgi:hypothetical protein
LAAKFSLVKSQLTGSTITFLSLRPPSPARDHRSRQLLRVRDLLREVGIILVIAFTVIGKLNAAVIFFTTALESFFHGPAPPSSAWSS